LVELRLKASNESLSDVMVLILTDEDAQGLVTMNDSIRVIEKAFAAQVIGEVVMPRRMTVTSPGLTGSLRVMPAAIPSLKALGLKTISGTPGLRKPSATYFVILLFDSANGDLLSVMGGDHLTRSNSKTLGLFGSGVQAEYQLRGVCAVRQITEAKVYDVDSNRCETFCQRMAADLSIPVTANSDPVETVRNVDIVATATTSTQPVIKGEWIQSSTHINAIGANTPSKREIDGPTLKKAKIVVDFRQQVLEEGGDIIDAIRTGFIGEDGIYAELGEIVTGKKQGRAHEDEITLFKSVGVAIQDIAVAKIACDLAVEKKLGIEKSL